MSVSTRISWRPRPLSAATKTKGAHSVPLRHTWPAQSGNLICYASSTAKRQRPSLPVNGAPGKKTGGGRLPIGFNLPQPLRRGDVQPRFSTGLRPGQPPSRSGLREGLSAGRPANSPFPLESSRPLKDFPILLPALSFEQNLPSLIAMLLAAGIEPLAEERRGRDIGAGAPLIIGGGVACSINPEPLAPFVEAMLVGEVEELLPSVLELLAGAIDRPALLCPSARIAGLLCSRSSINFSYSREGLLTEIVARARGAGAGPAAGLGGLRSSPVIPGSSARPPNLPISSWSNWAGAAVAVAASARRASSIVRPVSGLRSGNQSCPGSAPGRSTSRVGLLGMEMARPDDLQVVAERLLAEGCQLSFSSLRADALTPELCNFLPPAA